MTASGSASAKDSAAIAPNELQALIPTDTFTPRFSARAAIVSDSARPVFMTFTDNAVAPASINNEPSRKDRHPSSIKNGIAETASRLLNEALGTSAHGSSKYSTLCESKSRPTQGIVTFEHRGFNQRDEEIAYCRRVALMLRRPA